MMQVAARTYPLIDELRRRYRGKSVLLVCHGSIARVIHTYFHNVTNEEFAAFRMDNGEVFAYEADDLPEDNRSVTIRALQEDVSSFNRARDWTGLSALNFAASISIEAAELLEIFQWCDQKEADQKALVTEREHFLEELADVLIYSIGLADQYGCLLYTSSPNPAASSLPPRSKRLASTPPSSTRPQSVKLPASRF